MSEPCDLSAVEARRLIGAKKLSPVELLESCLGRIAATNGKVNSVVAIDEALARSTAKQQEAEAAKQHAPANVSTGEHAASKDETVARDHKKVNCPANFLKETLSR